MRMWRIMQKLLVGVMIYFSILFPTLFFFGSVLLYMYTNIFILYGMYEISFP